MNLNTKIIVRMMFGDFTCLSCLAYYRTLRYTFGLYRLITRHYVPSFRNHGQMATTGSLICSKASSNFTSSVFMGMFLTNEPDFMHISNVFLLHIATILNQTTIIKFCLVISYGQMALTWIAYSINERRRITILLAVFN